MNTKKDHRVFLGLGSNLGDRRSNLLSALRLLDAMEGIEILEVSSVYETEAWGMTEQPDFLNLVAMASTHRDPRGVLSACGEVEGRLGRTRDEKWGPRVIDVDILIYDDMRWEEEDLVIPHPHMLERDFVLVPLLELDADVMLPGSQKIPRQYRPRDPNKVKKAFRYGKEEWHG